MRRWWFLAIALGSVVSAGALLAVAHGRGTTATIADRVVGGGSAGLIAPANAQEADSGARADAFDERFGMVPVAGAQPLIPPSPPPALAVPAPIVDTTSQFSPDKVGSAVPPDMKPADRAIVLQLVRTTLIALHQANITGNYTVFRDLGSPSFQQKNTNSQLSEVFGPLRKSGVALDAVALFDPNIVNAEITADKMLQIDATLATKPVPVRFELFFQNVEGAWRLYTIVLGPDKAAIAAAGQKPAATSTQ
jgi:hypothetical protein